MVVTRLLAADTRALKGLVLVQRREHAKDHWDLRVQADSHETFEAVVADVLKVHRRSLDHTSNGDNGIYILALDHLECAHGQLPAAGYRVDGHLLGLYARLVKRFQRPLDKRVNNFLVPSSMHDTNLQLLGTGEGLRSWCRSFDR